MAKALFLIFGLLAFCLYADSACAQGSGSQDSVVGGSLRPRRDTYIIETYPSPARRGQVITIRFYNQNSQELALRVLDINDKVVKELQPRAALPNGIHSYDFPTRQFATGTYHIRLTKYSATGAADLTQDSRFIVLR